VIWAILVFLGVPLWLCAVGILVLVFRNRALRKRPGNMSVRVRRPGRQRWTRANALWVSDVFVWRASPAAWAEDVRQIAAVNRRTATTEERAKLHRLGDDVALVSMTTSEGDVFDVAASGDAFDGLFGPHLHDREVARSSIGT
jgi:hypothetical protein